MANRAWACAEQAGLGVAIVVLAVAAGLTFEGKGALDERRVDGRVALTTGADDVMA